MVLSITLLAVAAFVSYQSIICLIYCSEETGLNTYSELAYYCYGEAFKIFVDIIFFANNFGTAVSATILVYLWLMLKDTGESDSDLWLYQAASLPRYAFNIQQDITNISRFYRHLLGSGAPGPLNSASFIKRAHPPEVLFAPQLLCRALCGCYCSNLRFRAFNQRF